MSNTERLDAAESVFYSRQLEHIAPQLYNVKYADLMARKLIPTIAGVAEWAKVFTYRGVEQFGTAKVIADMADDLPTADVKGAEVSSRIVTVGSSFWYSKDEIKAAQAMGVPLEFMKAEAARRAVEQKIDTLIATGDATSGIVGLLDATGMTTVTAGTKTAGGTAWSLTGVADEIVLDVLALVSKLVLDSKGIFQKFRIVLPIDKYNILAQKRMGDGSNMTLLAYIKASSPYVEDIFPWYVCSTSGTGAVTQMCAFPADPRVVGAIVPREFTMEMPQDRNLASVINCTAKCGGVAKFYPSAIGQVLSI